MSENRENIKETEACRESGRAGSCHFVVNQERTCSHRSTPTTQSCSCTVLVRVLTRARSLPMKFHQGVAGDGGQPDAVTRDGKREKPMATREAAGDGAISKVVAAQACLAGDGGGNWASPTPIIRDGKPRTGWIGRAGFLVSTPTAATPSERYRRVPRIYGRPPPGASVLHQLGAD